MTHAERSTKRPSGPTVPSAQRAFTPFSGCGLSAPRSTTMGLLVRLGIASLLLLCAITLPAVPASARVIHDFKSSFGAGQLSLSSAPLVEHGTAGRSGLAVNDATHDIYVADTEDHRVVEFSAAGDFIRVFGADVGGPGVDVCTTGCDAGTSTHTPGGFEAPTFIAVDNSPGLSKGDVYVADTAAKLVSKFDAEGALIASWGSGGQLDGSAASGGPFTLIDGIAVDGSGVLNVYDGSETKHNWFEFTQDGTAEPTIKVERETVPSGIAVDTAGNLFKVVGFGHVTEYSASGIETGEVDAGESDSGLAVDGADNSIYIDVNGLQIQHFGSSCASAAQPCAVLDSFGQAQLTKGGGLAVDSDGTLYAAETADSEIEAFEPLIIPDTTSEPATALEQHTATLNGHVDPAGGGEVTSCRFAYVEAVHYEPNAANPYASGQTHTCSPATPYAEAKDVSGALTGLLPDTTYHFRLEAASPNGTFDTGEDETFTTAGPPLVKEEHVTDIEPGTATLDATINPSGYPTEYRFEYGTSASYGSQTSLTLLAASGHGDEPVEASISALTKATVYHYRAVAQSECEPLANPGHICVEPGPDAEFETLPAVSVREFTTQTVGPELVTLKAQLDPNNGGSTHYTICYGTEPGHSPQGCAEGSLKKVGNEFEPITATFTGLQPDTEYHYQLTASNTNGEVKTNDATFTTELSATEERAAEDCPQNGSVHGAAGSALREENNSLSLPDCRAYEQVSPSFKAASSALAPELSPGGDHVGFNSIGVFAGAAETTASNFYSAHRTAAGWLTQSSEPSRPETGFKAGQVIAKGADLDRWLASANDGLTTRDSTPFQHEAYYLGSADGSFIRATPIIGPLSGRKNLANDPVVAQSGDLSHLFISTETKLLAEDPLPDSPLKSAARDRIYEVSGAGGASPVMRLVAEVPAGLAGFPGEARCQLDRRFGHNFAFNASAEDGSALFYTAPVEVSPHTPCDNAPEVETANKTALYVCSLEAGPCVDGLPGAHAPVQVSAEDSAECQSPSPCAGAPLANAEFYGASPDASLAWFTTSQPLINSDTDATPDLYLAKLKDGQVSQLIQASAGAANPSHPILGAGAGVRGVLEVSPDGTHAAFVAAGVLTEVPNANGQRPETGADNLYLYDSSSGETKFVTRLCSGFKASGSVADSACAASNASEGFDSQLWDPGSTSPPAQLTPDGNYLLFNSIGRLTPDDTDSVRDVYRYDFLTGELSRLSFGRNGNDGNGNDDTFGATIESYADSGASPGSHESSDITAGDPSRAISADGSVAIFLTAAPLTSHDTNAGADPGCGTRQTGCDVYEWERSGHGGCHEAAGCISLISDGLDPHGATNGVISSSGADVIFLTARGLLPSDTDGLGDVYDARESGGFPLSPPPIPCGGNEICHGSAGSEPTPPKITTESETHGNDTHLHCAKGRVRQKRHGQIRCVAKKRHRVQKHHKPADSNRGEGK